MFGRISAKARDARGANLVEFALALLLLLLILGGIADLGRAFHIYIAMANGAREGARYGARLPCTTLPTNRGSYCRYNDGISFQLKITSYLTSFTIIPIIVSRKACFL